MNDVVLDQRSEASWALMMENPVVNPTFHRIPSSECFHAIYHEHFEFVWRSLARMGVPESEREDVAQEVFLVVMRRIDEFESRSSIRTWLYGIARNLVRNRHRKTSRHIRKLASFEHSHLNEPSYDPVEQSDAHGLLVRLLGELDQQKQDIYILTQLEGLSFVEISREVGVEQATLRSRLHAAKRLLVEAAKRHIDEGSPR